MESIQYAVLLLGAIFCAYRAIVAKRILSATIYLACISALTSAIIYLLGATEVAVMELSVGAGLVTVLLVYALSVVGDDAMDPASVIPKPLAFGIVGLVTVILGWMAYPALQSTVEAGSTNLANVLWQNRVLDVWIQIALIFSGVMGVLGLLSEQTHHKNKEMPQ
ncbi:MAG TPA: hydrogenase subunit MbhD domain-containing protein [Anaerolineales bacterium]|nr:hydrogenase subunit MbhD domain-containing protein [Anaerolineales bacterium]